MTVQIPPSEPPAGAQLLDGRLSQLSELRSQRFEISGEALRQLSRVATIIASDAPRAEKIQTLLDAAVGVTGAGFGAFFVRQDVGGVRGYRLEAGSGASIAAIASLDWPYRSVLFNTALEQGNVARPDDFSRDGFSQQDNADIAKISLRVASYLAAPISAQDGGNEGILCLGHSEAAMFPPGAEGAAALMAANGAVLLANDRLVLAAHREVEYQRKTHDVAAQLAAIIESSDDAILSKSLEGTILSWNKGAQLLFGYEPDEIIGQPVSVLIPAERHNEEPSILDRVRRGERVDHYQTVRRRKDGTFVDISLTVSPVRDAAGKIVGASKIARDITEQRRSQERQTLLLKEMHHRIKNLFALATGVVAISARSAQTPAALAVSIRERLMALARAHELTLPDLHAVEARPERTATLISLLQTILAPYSQNDGDRISISGTDTTLHGSILTNLALLLHEFATNAAKYGALSVPEGRLTINLFQELAGPDDRNGYLVMIWSECDGPEITTDGTVEGFGSRLAKATVEGQLQGSIKRHWRKTGLDITLRLPLARLVP